MSPSRPFILRPVATVLLMVAILLCGIVAYFQLPVSALPQVDYPTIQVVTFYPGASPEVMASSVTAPLERQFGQVPGLNQMTSTSSDGSSVITLQFMLDLNIDVAEQQVQAAINAAATFLPTRLAQPADLQQDQSGRRADPDAGADLRDAAAVEGRGLGRHAAGAEDLAAIGRGPGEHQRRAEAGDPHAGQSDGASALGLNLEDVRTAIVAANVNQAKGNFDGQPAGLHDRRQRSAADQRRSTSKLIVAYRNGARSSSRTSPTSIDGVENVRQAAWMNEDAGRDSEHPAAARGEHHRGRRAGQEAARSAQGRPCPPPSRSRC